jgi:hypothetical protein
MTRGSLTRRETFPISPHQIACPAILLQFAARLDGPIYISRRHSFAQYLTALDRSRTDFSRQTVDCWETQYKKHSNHFARHKRAIIRQDGEHHG